MQPLLRPSGRDWMDVMLRLNGGVCLKSPAGLRHWRRDGSTRALAGLIMVLGLSACGTVPLWDAPLRLPESQVQVTADPRIGPADQARLNDLSAAVEARATLSGERFSILALSGGGAKGAYGAGVLVGWSAAGVRPEFDVVTGVSTGALAAPFAFLGSTWDDQLRSAYLESGTQEIVTWRLLSILMKPSLFSSRALESLVDRYVTPELLAAIAVEHDKGRRLIVVTTNLGNETPVIWDMGLLAKRTDPGGLALFRQVLVASASIPAVFPPVMIAGLAPDGAIVQEMHVDGSVTAPFLAVPEQFIDMAGVAEEEGGGDIYVLINSQIEARTRPAPATAGRILGRSYEAMSKANTRAHLAATRAFAARLGLDFHLSAIPADMDASSFDFSPEAMERLFNVGRSRAAEGKAWTSTPATVVPPVFPATSSWSAEPLEK